MGLDITAYSKLALASDTKCYESGDPIDYENHVRFHASTLEWTEQHWPRFTNGIQPGIYSFEKALRFRAGSYSGYNSWRNDLCQFVHGASAERLWRLKFRGSFTELICFADNEGVIGAVVATKLARDFECYAGTMAQIAGNAQNGWWFLQYRNWSTAFALAADGGAVHFH